MSLRPVIRGMNAGRCLARIEPGDTVRLVSGIHAKRRRMVDGKRRTVWVKLAEVTPEMVAAFTAEKWCGKRAYTRMVDRAIREYAKAGKAKP